MYLIALCDDEERELDQIEACLVRYQQARQAPVLRTERFTNGEALLKRMREGEDTPDLLLLDIFMTGRNGIDVAEEIRACGCRIPIVFLTASMEHALKAYGVDAIQYLVKPLERERFFHAMDAALEFSRRMDNDHVILKISGGIRQIKPDQIVYCESQKNYQVVHLAGEEYKARITAGKLWEMLERFPQFGRCGRSYILNMDHIVSVEREEIKMDNGRKVYIPRNKSAEFKKIYFAYYFEPGV